MLQMESLLELVQMEQNIYNSVFHEVIRQVAVSCAERGQLLAKLRLASMLKAPAGPSPFISKQTGWLVFFWCLSCAFCLQTALPVAPGANPPLSEGPAHRGRGTEGPQPPAGRGDRPDQDVLPAAQHVRGAAVGKLVMKTPKETAFIHLLECVSQCFSGPRHRALARIREQDHCVSEQAEQAHQQLAGAVEQTQTSSESVCSSSHTLLLSF